MYLNYDHMVLIQWAMSKVVRYIFPLIKVRRLSALFVLQILLTYFVSLSGGR